MSKNISLAAHIPINNLYSRSGSFEVLNYFESCGFVGGGTSREREIAASHLNIRLLRLCPRPTEQPIKMYDFLNPSVVQDQSTSVSLLSTSEVRETSYLNDPFRILHRYDNFAYSILLREEAIRLRNLGDVENPNRHSLYSSVNVFLELPWIYILLHWQAKA